VLITAQLDLQTSNDGGEKLMIGWTDYPLEAVDLFCFSFLPPPTRKLPYFRLP